jgi:hypothetical protein
VPIATKFDENANQDHNYRIAWIIRYLIAVIYPVQQASRNKQPTAGWLKSSAQRT